MGYHFSGSFGFNYAVSQDDDNEDIPRVLIIHWFGHIDRI
jgi:hypothetical protein